MNNIFTPVIIGKIGKSYGIKGWNKLISFTQKVKNIFSYTPWFIFCNKKYQIIELENWKFYKKNIILKIKNINNRNEAQKIQNYKIIVNFKTFPKLTKYEYYWKDIIDCKIINLNFDILGKVFRIIHSNIYHILLVKSNINNLNKKNKEYLIPFTKNIIKDVNIDSKIIKVKWII